MIYKHVEQYLWSLAKMEGQNESNFKRGYHTKTQRGWA